jgi:DNA (cytosine-5)-methyltransferase 1
MQFNYKWNLSDAVFAKNKGKVFSCFACAGGSTMGYKLAGFDVVGFNEIDPKLAKTYIANHSPKYSYIEPIQAFKDRVDLPADLYDLDILDGSPPCSSFSLAGRRDKDWGKEKYFREGQSKQVLDTLFFDFIDLAKRLQPKVVVAENVEGLTQGKAKKYLVSILQALDDAGYIPQFQVLDSSEMGVPQRRRRVFIFGLRKDLAALIPQKLDLFSTIPILNLSFSEREIPFSEIDTGEKEGKICDSILQLYDAVPQGANFGTAHPKGSYFSLYKAHYNKPLPTIAGVNQPQSNIYHPYLKRAINDTEMILGSSFPLDFDFGKTKVLFACAMSVPPVMVAQVANQISLQWLTLV